MQQIYLELGIVNVNQYVVYVADLFRIRNSKYKLICSLCYSLV